VGIDCSLMVRRSDQGRRYDVADDTARTTTIVPAASSTGVVNDTVQPSSACWLIAGTSGWFGKAEHAASTAYVLVGIGVDHFTVPDATAPATVSGTVKMPMRNRFGEPAIVRVLADTDVSTRDRSILTSLRRAMKSGLLARAPG
jgi:hypothetical protein